LKSLLLKVYHSHFLSLCEFGNFYVQKIRSWKRWEFFFSLCWFV